MINSYASQNDNDASYTSDRFNQHLKDINDIQKSNDRLNQSPD